MNPVSHKWKADPDADAVHGFIAQEIQEIVPEAVSKGDNEDDMWSMDYGRITPVLVAALQDAHKKIEELAAEVAKLKAN
jgi:predicted ATPase